MNSHKDTILHDGHWLSLRTRQFKDRAGNEHTWEFVTRNRTAGAVLIIPILPGPKLHVVLIKQFRPALGSSILEFPAGLLEPGEDPEVCALRELMEETGCSGQVIAKGPPSYSTPGLTDENVIPVIVRVDKQDTHQPELVEQIEVLEFPLQGLRASLEAEAARGLHIDGKLWFFAAGLEFMAANSSLFPQD